MAASVSFRIIIGDALAELHNLPDASVHCCVTSPPYYGLRDYGVAGQLGLEATPDEYVAGMVAVFREVRRVLRSDGVLFLNIGDSYAAGGNGGGGKNDTNAGSLSRGPKKAPAGYKPKDLIGIPWMLAFALRADGWYLRQDIIWSKSNPMPESVTDRCTKSHEYVFLLSKSARYYYDAAAIAEAATFPGVRVATPYTANAVNSTSTTPYNGNAAENRNRRSVWSIATQPFGEAHFATMAPDLAERCINAGCPVGGIVLDPFGGAGTTGLVADRLQRNAILIELNPEYAAMARRRIDNDAPMFADAPRPTLKQQVLL